MTNLQHASTPPGPLQVRGGFAVRAIDFTGSVLAVVSGGAFVESLMLAAAGRFAAAACGAGLAAVAWLAVQQIDRRLLARVGR